MATEYTNNTVWNKKSKKSPAFLNSIEKEEEEGQ